jgi:hypothetical protein
VGKHPRSNHASALQNELAFGSKKNRSEFEHPRGCRQANARPPGLAQQRHELQIRDGIGRRYVDRAIEIVMLD